MNKIFLAISLLLVYAFTQSDPKITGTWKHISDKESSFEFLKSGFLNIIIGKDTINGESYLMGGEEFFTRYKTNTEVIPHKITLSTFNTKTKIKVTEANGIYEYLKNGKMKIYINFEDFSKPTTYHKIDTDTFMRVNNKKD